MPLYEYRCPDCERDAEVLQGVGEGGERLRCPHCNRVGLDRKASTFAARGFGGTAAGYAAPNCTGFT